MTAPSENPKQWNVGLIGYGEVGRILAEDLRQQDVKVAAYDIKLRGDQAGWTVAGHMESPIEGGDGNREYLIAAKKV